MRKDAVFALFPDLLPVHVVQAKLSRSNGPCQREELRSDSRVHVKIKFGAFGVSLSRTALVHLVTQAIHQVVSIVHVSLRPDDGLNRVVCEVGVLDEE